jgi:type IV secretory pathway VirB2 component (pilin)
MLEKIKSFGNKVIAGCAVACAAVHNAAAEAVVTLPATAKTDLADTVTDNFPTIIGVIVIIIACGLLIKLLRKL